jgi:hypothetical protein
MPERIGGDDSGASGMVNVIDRRALPATGDAGLATQHVTPLRLRVFAATQRPVAVHDVTIETSWGSVRVRGRLGQRHADVYETIRRVACDQRTEPDGARVLLVDPADVRRGLGDGWYSAERIDALLDDLLHAVIDLRCPRGRARGHFIDQITETAVAVSARGGIQTEPRRLWRVRRSGSARSLGSWRSLRPATHHPAAIRRGTGGGPPRADAQSRSPAAGRVDGRRPARRGMRRSDSRGAPQSATRAAR